MANAIKGEVIFEHDGASYTLVLDFNALADFEDATGQNAMKALAGGDLTISQMRALFHAGLKDRHPDVSLKDAGAMLQANLPSLGEALKAAFPDAKPGNVAGRSKARR